MTKVLHRVGWIGLILIADIAVPVLLLLCAPAVFTRAGRPGQASRGTVDG